jgi:hypothetical protein
LAVRGALPGLQTIRKQLPASPASIPAYYPATAGIPGENGTLMIVAADRRQARVIMRYCIGLLRSVPMLSHQIESVTRESITLKNRIVIEIHTASFRTTRGYTCVTALLDELAYWEVDEDSASPDIEVINAIRPGMATIPEAMLLCASSPHARRGALWDAHRKHYGQEHDPVLVWQAPTRAMNASVPQSYIDSHMADDPARAAAEYLAQFRSDLESFVAREAAEACISWGVRERPPLRDVAYVGFIDPSGGSSDAMALCVGHLDHNKETVVIDALREAKPPFSPEIVTSEFCALLRSYYVSAISGDRYGGEWPIEQFAKYGVRYESAAKPKSGLYTDLLPLVNSRRIDLLDHSKTINQLIGLERRSIRGGGSSIDHGPNQHDDLINTVAGVASICTTKGTFNLAALTDDAPGDRYGVEGWRRLRLQMYINSGGRIVL